MGNCQIRFELVQMNVPSIFASLSMAFHGIENMKEETYLRSLEIKYSTAFRCHRIKAADHSVMRRSIFY